MNNVFSDQIDGLISAIAAHRRVIHIEFAADDLPCGLEWHERILS
ncbi:MAG: hypothetical protein SGI88_10760 [Candidatus Hydrogenedentes bacterium]|nr:hypothetical protein [Candidatus Hydrogenedentota bacterium]